jgi:DnaJ-class molecular chaperone
MPVLTASASGCPRTVSPGAPAGDLYVTIGVDPDPVFGRDGNDLTVTVPVGFSGELIE